LPVPRDTVASLSTNLQREHKRPTSTAVRLWRPIIIKRLGGVIIYETWDDYWLVPYCEAGFQLDREVVPLIAAGDDIKFPRPRD
jgi:hypothetical protein